ncbi:hypothetical protein COCSADRAFT_102645 [Bipolaris sorokiniana ND90Pr]|uniref:Large ribosomal subunit protein mL67 n=1 Tax=Cochliobolus sativus (strain ND90Pr / ATCC 201652) TaxID=665912 RepID=M2SPY5_COCSN|nr:uncharacterized protein COCSADRAFT_102645 [Bipolaris sorokiniana ND90Pr]EMD58832.1 hypothetical protein COCSADRAFT_102645 [Bipolaris sorokiniana ND90Pr]
MPRSLARLRYKPPLKPISFAPAAKRTTPVHEELLHRRVAAYVQRQSNPKHLRLQTVVNEKARRQATGQHVNAPIKPYTLRDVVDPEGTAKHGEIIYIFRNTKTNQVIYSLQELLDNHHLDQLPFIGKHSKPPALRPDEWVPHCVVTFPTPAQGHSAFRKLREFRKLHETAWDKTNPEMVSMDRKQRIKKIMNQRANTSADLAEVLRIQEEHGVQAAEELLKREQKATAVLDKRWQEIDALANASLAKEKPTDNVKWLQGQIRSMDLKLKMRHHQNEADQKSLKATQEALEARLRKLQYAIRKAEQFKKLQQDLAKQAAPAHEPGAEAKLDELRSQARVLDEALQNPDPSRSASDLEMDAKLLAQQRSEIDLLEQAFDAKAQAESRDHYIARSVLPKALKKTPVRPYTLNGISVQWADMQDALYAAGKWPDAIEHEPLEINRMRGEILLLSAEEYEIEKSNDVGRVMEALQSRGQMHNGLRSSFEPSGVAPALKISIPTFLPVRNAFKSATA